MARESIHRANMQTAQARADYVGAFIEDERRLTLVAIDPADPWEAFKSLRRSLRRNDRAAEARIALFEADQPLEHTADVISIASRRRAG